MKTYKVSVRIEKEITVRANSETEASEKALFHFDQVSHEPEVIDVYEDPEEECEPTGDAE